MVKKTYICPDMVAVSIGTHLMMAQSVGFSDDELDNDDALVKEMDNVGRTSSHNIWDNEW
ncbi:MAG: hypothetical protein IJ219_05715 [Bacteroidaceae bacterium]|nr:hypothetical protein [Bacteroidaceae bacterium]MBQ9170166.1 hypothetical protein [Bacteroidaceae bacterium]MBQ9294408.1 hypothetical protein [Bacteroidaceae bacterium]MBR1411534.1 hypothetical protein [Prevotella sp.]